MSKIDSSNNFCFGENKTMMDLSITASNSNDSVILQCFVCDASVQGRHYALATCRTQGTETRVIEKLGELVGERYMVVISEDDVICRSCANLINTLDRLETEIKGVAGTVLRYLERKYCLEDGELLNNAAAVKPSQPPHVTAKESKKKRPVDVAEDAVPKKKKKSTTLQCDKCRYTTNYNTFMVHHMRQHINQKINCDKCGAQFMGNNQQNNPHNCNDKEKPQEVGLQVGENVENFVTKVEPLDVLDESIPVEIIPVESLPVEGVPLVQKSLPILTADDQEIEIKGIDENNGKLITIPDFENLQSKIHENVESAELMLSQESKTHNSSTIVLAETDSVISDVVLQKKDFSTKQILTVAEDGSLEMMEMETWVENNEMLKQNDL